MASLSASALEQLRQEPIDWRFKGFPDLGGRTLAELPGLGLNLRTGGFSLPIATLRASALEHNLAWMAALVAERGAQLAPHAKTTMSPQLVDRQLAAGAWGITVANVSQARVFTEFGAERIIIANEVIDAVDIAWIARTAQTQPSFRPYLLADSIASVRLLEDGLAAAGTEIPPIPVLVELGTPGARAGARTPDQVLEVADAVAASPHLRLAGLEGFEGAVPGARRVDREPGIRALLRSAADALREFGRRDLLGDEVLVSFGGSAYFDLVLDELAGLRVADRDATLVLRSGCSLIHDHGLYAETAPAAARGALRPALEVRGSVLSRPEPGLAIVGFGRRDVSSDAGLPIPLRVLRSCEPAGDVPAGSSRVVALNDQHAFVEVDPMVAVEVGDTLVAGISHPCTTFDRWRLIPVIDEHDTVVDAIRTFF